MQRAATSAPVPEIAGLRANFPVLSERAYLNAGTDGPLASSAVEAARAELARALATGRTGEHFERRRELQDALRAAYARVLACSAADVALTTCTSEGVELVVGGLGLGPGDEILTSDEEHPGLLGALQAARDLDGVSVRVAPFDELAGAVGPQTSLVACSHVSWVTGAVAPVELAELPAEVPVLLDGAQGAGAVPTNVAALGADAYAGSGQKWLCGPDGTGMLYVSPALRERLQARRRGYLNLADPGAGLAAALHPDGRRFDTFALAAETLACALAGISVLEAAGWEPVHARAGGLAARLAELIAQTGTDVRARGASTLVSFAAREPDAARTRLAERGVIVRDIPGQRLLRASVGAWNDEHDLERLLEALALPA